MMWITTYLRSMAFREPPTAIRKRIGSSRNSRSRLASAGFVAALLLCIGIILNECGLPIAPGPFGRALAPLPTPGANQQFHPQIASDQAINASTPPTTDQQIADAMQRLREKLVEVRLVQKESTDEDVQLSLTEATVSRDVSTDQGLRRSIERAEDVKEIQKQLGSLGYFSGPV